MAATAGSFDFGRPFTYVFEDKDWITKVLFGGLVILGSFITLPLLLVGMVGFMLIGGFLRRLAIATADGAEVPIPDLFAQPGDDIVVGLKMLAINFVWLLPAILLRVVGIVLMLVISAASGGNDDASAAGGMLMLGTSCLAIPLQLLGSLVAFVGIIRFWDTGEFGAGFRLGEIFAFLKRSWINVLLAFVVMFVAIFAAEIVGILALCIGIFFTLFFAYLVMGQAIGQIIRLDRAARANG